jgi:N-acetylmuramoyl-L-alanine amidase
MRQRIMMVLLILIWGVTASFSKMPTNASAAASANSKPYPYLVNPLLTNVDILIDVGHGGIDSGTLHGNTLEKNINLEMGKLIYKLLKEKGLKVLLNRMDDYALSGENLWYRHRSRHLKDLAQRSHLANEIRPKAVISLHVNWSKNNKVRGAVVLHQSTEASKQLAQYLQQSLNTLYATQTDPNYGKTYFLLKHVQVPAVIIEMGFISNPMDREQMLQPQKQRQLAEAIATGVMAYLQIKQAP